MKKQDDKFGEYYLDLLNRGLYINYLMNYLDKFSARQIKILLFDDISQRPESTYREILDFLNIDASFTPSNLNTKPKKNVYSDSIIRFERYFSNIMFMRKITDYISQRLISGKKQPILTRENLNFLNHYYHDSIEMLDDMFRTYPDLNRENISLSRLRKDLKS